MALRCSNVVAFIINLFCTFGISYLGEFGYGETNVEIGAKYPTILTPPWFAFPVVWLPIFIFEAAFVLWQLFQPRTNVFVHHGIAWWFVAACLFQAAWNIAFAKEFLILSAVLMAAVTKCLHIALMRLTLITYKEGAPRVGCGPCTVIWLPFGIHAAWTMWACAVNIMVCLTAYTVSADIQLAVAIVLLAWVFGINLVFTVICKNAWYGLVGAWALICIAQNQLYTDKVLIRPVGDAIQYACLGLCGLLVVAVIGGTTFIRRWYIMLLFWIIGNPKDALPRNYISAEETGVAQGSTASYLAVSTYSV